MSETRGRHVIEHAEREEIAKPKKKRIGLRILIGILCVLLLVAGGAALFVNSKLNRMQRTSASAPLRICGLVRTESSCLAGFMRSTRPR